MLQLALNAYRTSYEEEIPNRWLNFRQTCEKILTPDQNENPEGCQPIEHKATIIYADRARLDTLLTITYQRTFGSQPSFE